VQRQQHQQGGSRYRGTPPFEGHREARREARLAPAPHEPAGTLTKRYSTSMCPEEMRGIVEQAASAEVGSALSVPISKIKDVSLKPAENAPLVIEGRSRTRRHGAVSG